MYLCVSLCLYVSVCLSVSVCVGLLPCVVKDSDFCTVESGNRLCSPNSKLDLASRCRVKAFEHRACSVCLARCSEPAPLFLGGDIAFVRHLADCTLLLDSPGTLPTGAGVGDRDSMSQAGPFPGQPLLELMRSDSLRCSWQDFPSVPGLKCQTPTSVPEQMPWYTSISGRATP